MRHTLILCAVLVLGIFNSAAAQQAPVAPGSRVRLWTQTNAKGRPSGPETTGTVTSLSADTLVLQMEGSAGSTSVLLPSVSRLEVSHGPERWSRSALRGGAIGAGVGVLLTLLITSGPEEADGPYCKDSGLGCASEPDVAFGIAALGGTGAVIGALIGIVRGGERWERVPLPSWSILPTGRNSLAVSTGYRF